ncbi:GNAT family N-acetyltransferase [Amnibacterium endophyticum]|uniref:GNAT family N-acetyltransferase n=1 Tax=Amnibacterium endophyticum TaxID=2109337 RepID=A0ABW4LDC7_9MICO
MRLIDTHPDDPATAGLLDAYFAERAAGFPGGGYRVARPAPDAFRAPGALIRAEDVGIVGLRPLDADDAGVRMEVKHLYVAPAARGTGLGRLLLAAAVERAREAGAATVVLDTNRSLEAAGGLYRSVGFRPVPPYNDNPNATDWYALPLD